mgnify:FL=1
MAHVPSLPPLPGVDDLYSLLAFLSDKDACESRLMEMERLRDEMNGLVEKVGKADEIDRLRIQADVDRDMAGKELAQGRSRAKQAADDFAKEMQSKQDEFDARCRIFTGAMDKRTLDIKEAEATIFIHEANIKAHDEKVTAREHATEARWNEAAALKAEYEAKLAKLKAAGVV